MGLQHFVCMCVCVFVNTVNTCVSPNKDRIKLIHPSLLYLCDQINLSLSLSLAHMAAVLMTNWERQDEADLGAVSFRQTHKRKWRVWTIRLHRCTQEPRLMVTLLLPSLPLWWSAAGKRTCVHVCMRAASSSGYCYLWDVTKGRMCALTGAWKWETCNCGCEFFIKIKWWSWVT